MIAKKRIAKSRIRATNLEAIRRFLADDLSSKQPRDQTTPTKQPKRLDKLDDAIISRVISF